MLRLISGMQASSGVPHLGNYLGAMRAWSCLAESYECFFMVADLHAITLPQDPQRLRANTLQMLAYYLAAGLDPERVVLFVQSHVSAHAELGWVLTTMASMGELSRMTQFKDKSSKTGAHIPAGLFAYPTLMAADILLYQADHVPVGEDQKQHLELTRDLALRVNARLGEVFKVPQPWIPSQGGRIMDLQEPATKMSKSSVHPKGVLFLSDSDTVMAKKLKAAVTDSGTEVPEWGACSAGLRNLIHIVASLEGEHVATVAARWQGRRYGELKLAVADQVVATLGPLRARALTYLQDETGLCTLLREGALKAQAVAEATLSQVYTRLGLLER